MSRLGSKRFLGGKVVVEAAVGETRGLHQVRQTDAFESMLTEKATGCFDDAMPVSGDLRFGQFHLSIFRGLGQRIPEKRNQRMIRVWAGKENLTSLQFAFQG